jgi:hypothetical protein
VYQLWGKRLGGYDEIRSNAGLAIVATPLARSYPLCSNLGRNKQKNSYNTMNNVEHPTKGG